MTAAPFVSQEVGQGNLKKKKLWGEQSIEGKRDAIKKARS